MGPGCAGKEEEETKQTTNNKHPHTTPPAGRLAGLFTSQPFISHHTRLFTFLAQFQSPPDLLVLLPSLLTQTNPSDYQTPPIHATQLPQLQPSRPQLQPAQLQPSTRTTSPQLHTTPQHNFTTPHHTTSPHSHPPSTHPPSTLNSQLDINITNIAANCQSVELSIYLPYISTVHTNTDHTTINKRNKSLNPPWFPQAG